MELLEGRRDRRVELATPARRKRRQRRLVEQPVPESADELWVAPELAHDLGAEELCEIVARPLPGDVFENPHRELAAEDGGDLRQPAGTVRQSVDPRDEEALERRWEERRGVSVVVHVR